jgi:uncharacterized protein (TIGR00251 family)
MDWFEETPKGIVIHIKAQPKASKTQIVGLYGDPPRLKIKIAAPPVDGRANEELLKFLKHSLGVPISRLSLIRGDTSPSKDVLCMGVSKDKIKGLIPEGSSVPHPTDENVVFD